MTKNIIEIYKLKKIYNELGPSPKVAIEDVSFNVEEGEFLCVMGPSGSGKTTLVNILATIDSATSGIVKILGEDVVNMGGKAKAKYRKNGMGFIFQDYNLLDSLSIRDNIFFPLLVNNIDTKSKLDDFNEIINILDIGDILAKYPYECSGGQRQRVAIARAIILNPKIIIADEPTGNLDSGNSKELMELLLKINKEMGTTIILVTHDVFVASYSSRLLYMRDGKIEHIIVKEGINDEEYFNKIVDLNALSRKLVVNYKE